MSEQPSYEQLKKRVAELEKVERKLRDTEKALRESETRLNEFLDYSPVGMGIWDKEFRYLYINKVLQGINGPSKEEHIGHTIEEVLPEAAHVIEPIFERILSDCIPVTNIELSGEIPSRPGEITHYLVSYFPVNIVDGKSQYIGGVVVDITDHKKAEEAQLKSEERFALAMKFASDGLFDWNLETNQIYYSPGWKKMLGYKEDEISNEFSEWERLTKPEDVKESWEMINKLLQGTIDRFEKELHMLHKDGHWVDVLSRANVIFDENNKGIRIVGTHVDITERKKNENKIKEALEEKEVLLRELYHRTKNNMLVIISMLSLQSACTDDEKVLKIFQETENRIHTMALVHKKLYHSENLSDISLKEYITELYTGLIMKSYNVTPNDKISVAYDIDDINVLIDSAIPCGIILNELISNALKYAFPNSRKGQIKITIRKTNQGDTEIIFSDNGCGVPENFDFRNASTLGLRLIFTVAEHQLQGDIEFINDNGLQCQIKYKDIIYESRI